MIAWPVEGSCPVRWWVTPGRGEEIWPSFGGRGGEAEEDIALWERSGGRM